MDFKSIRRRSWPGWNQFAQHVEIAYEIPLGELHIGPQIDIGIEDEGIHYMIGIHFGIDF